MDFLQRCKIVAIYLLIVNNSMFTNIMITINFFILMWPNINTLYIRKIF